MMRFEQKKGNYLLSTDKTKLNIDLIHDFLANESYWAKGVARSKVEASVNGSLCFGIYHKDAQVGFARAVTDFATVAYIADVFVLEKYRGQGLGKWIIECILKYPAFQDLRRIMLLTATAQDFYAQYGFITTEAHKLYDYMEKVNPKRFEN